MIFQRQKAGLKFDWLYQSPNELYQMEKKIRLAIAEDVPELAKLTFQKFGQLKEIDALFVAYNGLEMVDKLKETQVDVILMDINMPVMNGIETTKKIKELYPNTKVIMHTVFDEDDKIFESILVGATGYILKDEKLSKVMSAIREAMDGGAPMSMSIASKVLTFIKNKSTSGNEKFNLTDRELQILQKIGKGGNYQEIADALFISPKTVRNHIEKIYKKLQVHNRVDAVTLALKNNLII